MLEKKINVDIKEILELRLKVSFGKAVPWWWRFAYLIPNIFIKYPDIAEDFTKVIQDDAFAKFIKQHVKAYVLEGTEPPDAIQGPIINIAEDIMAGREAVIRAGDYIAIRNQMKR